MTVAEKLISLSGLIANNFFHLIITEVLHQKFAT
jgi:hypothetical protein